MNEFVACLLDGTYWNTDGPRRKPSKRFEPDDIKITVSRTRRPSQPLTPEQRQRAKEAQEQRRLEETARRDRESQRNLARLQRERDGVMLFDDRILLGGEQVARNRDLLEQHNIVAVLNVTERVPNFHEETGKFAYKRIYVLDTNDQEIRSMFGEAAAFVAKYAVNGKRVLVHCKQGRSRSPSFALAYAMHSLNQTLAQAWQSLTSLLPEDHLNINTNFQRQLMHYERDLYQSNTHDFFARERKVVQPFTVYHKRSKARRRSKSAASATRNNSDKSNNKKEENEFDNDQEEEEEEDEDEEVQDELDEKKSKGRRKYRQEEDEDDQDDQDEEDDEDDMEEEEEEGEDAMDVDVNDVSSDVIEIHAHHEHPHPKKQTHKQHAQPQAQAQLQQQEQLKAEHKEDVEEGARAVKRRRSDEDAVTAATSATFSASALLSRLDTAHATAANALERAHDAERKLLEEQRARLALERRVLELEQLVQKLSLQAQHSQGQGQAHGQDMLHAVPDS